MTACDHLLEWFITCYKCGLICIKKNSACSMHISEHTGSTCIVTAGMNAQEIITLKHSKCIRTFVRRDHCFPPDFAWSKFEKRPRCYLCLLRMTKNKLHLTVLQRVSFELSGFKLIRFFLKL